MRLTRRGRLTITLTVSCLFFAAACTAYTLTRTPVGPALGLGTSPPCALTAGDRTLEWSRERAMTATTVAAVGQRVGASENGVATALARALRGPDDRVLNAAAARDVYRVLTDTTRPSARDLDVSRALLGHDGPALSCTVRTPALAVDLKQETPIASGLTPRADALRLAMREVFDKQILGGFAPRGIDSGHVEGSAHYEGRAIDVFFRPVSAENTRRGWLQAHWAVAHADRMQLATIIFDRHIWSAARSASGWRDYEHPDGPTDNPVLLHEDHVHLDVLEGTGPP